MPVWVLGTWILPCSRTDSPRSCCTGCGITVSWPKAKAGQFLGAGEHLAGSTLPLNPHGGNNSEGRSWAIGHVCEAALQLQGRAGPRQLPDVHTAMINGGALTLSGALVLHN
jgi:hypothetical protein